MTTQIRSAVRHLVRTLTDRTDEERGAAISSANFVLEQTRQLRFLTEDSEHLAASIAANPRYVEEQRGYIHQEFASYVGSRIMAPDLLDLSLTIQEELAVVNALAKFGRTCTATDAYGVVSALFQSKSLEATEALAAIERRFARGGPDIAGYAASELHLIVRHRVNKQRFRSRRARSLVSLLTRDLAYAAEYEYRTGKPMDDAGAERLAELLRLWRNEPDSQPTPCLEWLVAHQANAD
ncbi:MAG: hypothetical protein U0821_06880 [Chloroflexota bacterium]